MAENNRGQENNGKKGKSNRGFASMDAARQREIASKGGKAAHQKGVAHEWNSDEARNAGRKGGEAVSRDREHMSAIGRKGGEASHSSRANVAAPREAMTNNDAMEERSEDLGTEGFNEDTNRREGPVSDNL